MQNLTQSSKPELKYRAFNFSIKIIKFVEKLPKKQSSKIISGQLLRCATSVGANIVEAKASSSKRDFTRFFEISLKSANETKYWLALLREIEPKLTKDINLLLKEIEEISKIIGCSVLTLKGKR